MIAMKMIPHISLITKMRIWGVFKIYKTANKEIATTNDDDSSCDLPKS